MKKITKVIAMLLCVMTVVTSLPLATVLNATEIPTYSLEASKLEEEQEGTVVYCGTCSATVNEEDAYYTFPVYREGDLSKETSVILQSLDISALYGEDYELVAENVLVEADGKTLLEKNADSSQIVALDEEQTASVEEGAEISVEDEAVEVFQDNDNLVDALLDSYGTTGTALDYSATIVLNFAVNQNECEVKFRIFDDHDSEGQEAFTLMLYDAENAEICEPSANSVVIEDNEETEYSKIGFTDAEYNSQDGKATVTLERKGAEYSVADMTIKSVGDTAKAGTNYEEVYESVAFSPYETEKTIEIPVAGNGQFDLLLSDFTACEEGKITRATVNIDNESEDNSINGKKQFKINIGSL